jgi:hypothetical protein
MTELLDRRFQAMANLHDDSDWAEVRRSATRRRLRPLAFVTAAFLAVLAAAPALGLHRQVLDFFDSDPASSDVRAHMAGMDVGAPKGMAPGVMAAETRRIRLPDGSVIAVAPTMAVGFCT